MSSSQNWLVPCPARREEDFLTNAWPWIWTGGPCLIFTPSFSPPALSYRSVAFWAQLPNGKQQVPFVESTVYAWFMGKQRHQLIYMKSAIQWRCFDHPNWPVGFCPIGRLEDFFPIYIVLSSTPHVPRVPRLSTWTADSFHPRAGISSKLWKSKISIVNKSLPDFDIPRNGKA